MERVKDENKYISQIRRDNLDSVNITFNEKHNSVLHITTELHLLTVNKYNWFQKKMLKVFFNIEVEDIGEEQ